MLPDPGLKTIFTELWKGKSVGRSYMNSLVRKIDLDDPVLDIGAGEFGSSGYHHLIPNYEKKEIISIDINSEKNPTYQLDLEKENIPGQISASSALVMNFFEHVYNFEGVVADIYASLEKKGTLYGWIPFLERVHYDPGDYFRYTDEAINRVLKEAGFEEVEIRPCGTGALGASLSQMDFIIPRFILPFLFTVSLALDYLLSLPSGRQYRTGEDYPVGYFFKAVK